jgi:hypothetical protein
MNFFSRLAFLILLTIFTLLFSCNNRVYTEIPLKQVEEFYTSMKEKGMNTDTTMLNWEVQPLEVLNVKSSFFENEEVFPKGSVKFDNALLMTNIEHEWKSENLFH